MESSPPPPSASSPQASKSSTKSKTANSIVKMLKEKYKREAALKIQSECSENGYSETLNTLLEDLLSTDKPIDDPETIDWCKWLIAGGRLLSEFSAVGRFQIYLFML